MIVKYTQLRLRPADKRLREKVGDLSDLRESLKKNGQIHDLLVDEKWVVRIGTRRYLAMRNIIQDVKVDQRTEFSEDEWVILEAEENIRRRDFDTIEEVLALKRSKEAWERLHPETKAGAKGLKIIKKNQSDTTDVLEKPKLEVEEKEPEPRMTEQGFLVDLPEPPAQSFTEHMAKKKGVSRRTIERKIELADAITEKKIDKETVEKIRKKEISQHKVMQKLKKEEAENKRLAEIVRKRNEEAKKKTKKAKVVFKKPEPTIKADLYKKVWMCEECAKADVRHCPDCSKGFIVCKKSANLPFKDLNAEACLDIEKP